MDINAFGVMSMLPIRQALYGVSLIETSTAIITIMHERLKVAERFSSHQSTRGRLRFRESLLYPRLIELGDVCRAVCCFKGSTELLIEDFLSDIDIY